MTKTLFKSLSCTLLIGGALALGGCGTGPSNYSGSESPARNTVEMVRLAYPVLAESNGKDGLSRATLKGINRFLNDSAAGYGDRMLVDRGADVSDARVTMLFRHFQSLGLEIGRADGVYGAEPAPGNMTIYLERHMVQTPECSGLNVPSTPNHQNAPLPGYGCSTATALGLMVADPRDLVAGKTDPSATAEQTTRAVQALGKKK